MIFNPCYTCAFWPGSPHASRQISTPSPSLLEPYVGQVGLRDLKMQHFFICVCTNRVLRHFKKTSFLLWQTDKYIETDSNARRDPQWSQMSHQSVADQPAIWLINRQGLRGDCKTGRTSSTGDSYWHTVCVCVWVPCVCMHSCVFNCLVYPCVWAGTVSVTPKVRCTCLAVVSSLGLFEPSHRALIENELVFSFSTGLHIAFIFTASKAVYTLRIKPIWPAVSQLQWWGMFTVNGTLWGSE